MAAPDLTEFLQTSRPRRKPCPIPIAKQDLDAGQAAQLDAACAADAGLITSSAIVQWLAKRGHKTNTNLVSLHRKGACTCDPA